MEHLLFNFLFHSFLIGALWLYMIVGFFMSYAYTHMTSFDLPCVLVMISYLFMSVLILSFLISCLFSLSGFAYCFNEKRVFLHPLIPVYNGQPSLLSKASLPSLLFMDFNPTPVLSSTHIIISSPTSLILSSWDTSAKSSWNSCESWPSVSAPFGSECHLHWWSPPSLSYASTTQMLLLLFHQIYFFLPVYWLFPTNSCLQFSPNDSKAAFQISQCLWEDCLPWSLTLSFLFTLFLFNQWFHLHPQYCAFLFLLSSALGVCQNLALKPLVSLPIVLPCLIPSNSIV